jgi:hypothetical protein
MDGINNNNNNNNNNNDQLHAPAVLPTRKEPPVSIENEAGWAPEPVWTTWRRENS